MPVLLIEFLLLFVAAPALITFTRNRIPPIPVLWVATAYCVAVLRNDRAFSLPRIWDTTRLRQYAPSILILFGVALAIGIALVLRYAPGIFLELPKSNPLLWGAVMVLYPLLSVYPQGIVYRAFIFNRYRGLFGPGWAMVLVSAIAFAWVHILFRNPLALGLSFIAGLLFAFRYLQTGSLFVSSFEHALYGCAIFTIGLGRWFYHGAVRR